MGRKSRLKRTRRLSRATSSPDQSVPNVTSIPEEYNKPSTSVAYSRDATTTKNIVPDDFEDELADTPAKLVDKYLLSGRTKFPIIQIVFVLSIAASLWIFVSDNMSGSLVPGDWARLLWTLLKCGIPFAFFVVFWVAHNIFFRWIHHR